MTETTWQGIADDLQTRFGAALAAWRAAGSVRGVPMLEPAELAQFRADRERCRAAWEAAGRPEMRTLRDANLILHNIAIRVLENEDYGVNVGIGEREDGAPWGPRPALPAPLADPYDR